MTQTGIHIWVGYADGRQRNVYLLAGPGEDLDKVAAAAVQELRAGYEGTLMVDVNPMTVWHPETADELEEQPQ